MSDLPRSRATAVHALIDRAIERASEGCEGPIDVCCRGEESTMQVWQYCDPCLIETLTKALQAALLLREGQPQDEPVNWKASYHQACDDADAYRVEAERKAAKLEQNWRSCQHEISYLRELVKGLRGGPPAPQPGCPECGWNDVHSPQCRHAGQQAPPSDITAPHGHAGDVPATEPARHVVEFGIEVAQWSPCQSKRGVVIFSGNDILGHGYNYKPRGFDCDGSAACKATCRTEAIHAEQQALLSVGNKATGAEMLHVKTVNGVLVASGGPSCVQCSKLVAACGVAGFWLYQQDGWRRYETAEFHQLSLAASQAGTAPREVLRLASEFDDVLGRVQMYGAADRVRDQWRRLKDALLATHAAVPPQEP